MHSTLMDPLAIRSGPEPRKNRFSSLSNAEGQEIKMTRLWKNMLLTMLLVSSSFSAFIQSPIPTSSRENYLMDLDRDGKLDRISIKFLGPVNREYLDQMVDSLTFEWLDSAGTLSRNRVKSKDLVLDAKDSRRVNVDLQSLNNRLYVHTGPINNIRLFLKGGTVYSVPVRDRMVPMVRSAFFRGSLLQDRNGKNVLARDTLIVELSENVVVSEKCSEFIEYRSPADTSARVLTMTDISWNQDSSAAVLILDGAAPQRLMPRDSLRLLPDCVRDREGNVSSEQSRFVYVNGLYPLNFEAGSMVVDRFSGNEGNDEPVFQLLFKEVNSGYPNEQEWGVAMEVRSAEFDNVVRDQLGLKENVALDYGKLRVQYNVKIYTNLGEFVVGTMADVYGDDHRFENEAKRLFLKWNLMDGSRRRVGTGAYIANIAVVVTYDGKLVYRSDVHHGPTTRIFGVKRK